MIEDRPAREPVAMSHPAIPPFDGSRIVRLPIIPRDHALLDDRPLSATAREHGLRFHRWLQSAIEAPQTATAREQVARPGRRAIAAMLRRLLRL